jgi:hypothetical protein
LAIGVLCAALAGCTHTNYDWGDADPDSDATGLGRLVDTELPSLPMPQLTQYEKTAPLPATRDAVLQEGKDIAAPVDDTLHEVTGALPEGQYEQLFLSPCGILVSMATSDRVGSLREAPADDERSILRGFDPATMQQLWTLDLGFGLAQIQGNVTFGDSCELVLSVLDDTGQYGPGSPANPADFALAIDGHDGKLLGKVPLYGISADRYLSCDASHSTLACFGWRSIAVWDFSDIGGEPLWKITDAPPSNHPYDWGNIVDKWVRVTDGFVTVESNEYSFGRDATPDQFGDYWVDYKEAMLYGGFGSGQIIRVEYDHERDAGTFTNSQAICQITLWNPEEDLPVWDSAQPMRCNSSEFSAQVAGDVLVLSTSGDGRDTTDVSVTKAFDLATGKILWERTFKPCFLRESQFIHSVNAVTTCLLADEDFVWEVVDTHTGKTLINTDEPILENANFILDATPNSVYISRDIDLPDHKAVLIAKFHTRDFQNMDAKPEWVKQYNVEPELSWSPYMFTLNGNTYLLFENAKLEGETAEKTFLTRIG